jgi:hypothetical protein
MKEDKDLQPIEIDLTIGKNGEINEDLFRMLGSHIQGIMSALFGGTTFPVSIKGNRRQVRDFAKTIGSEKKYIKTAAKYGLDDPRTYKDKFKLRNMIRKFQSSTGLKWPFK